MGYRMVTGRALSEEFWVIRGREGDETTVRIGLEVEMRRSEWRREKRKVLREGDMHYFCTFVRIDKSDNTKTR